MRFIAWTVAAGLLWAGAASGATFGKVVEIQGQGSDLALDEARGYLYVANYTRNTIDRVSLANQRMTSSINVAVQPSALAMSPDGRYLVVAHYGNVKTPGSSSNALTVIDLSSDAKQTFVLGRPPLGVAFGIDGLALVLTTEEFLLFDPATGVTRTLGTIQALAAKTLPQPPASFPPNIVAASVAASGDGSKIYGLTDTLQFRYDVGGALSIISYVSSPVQGPRVVSVSRDGLTYASGWCLNDRFGHMLAEFPSPAGTLNVGSHAIDSTRRLIYAQIPEQGAAAGAAPVLQIADAGNLAVKERVLLPENLAGKSVMSSDDSVMYSISDSGVMILPVGSLSRWPRLASSQEDVIFRGNSCERRVASQQITIQDPGGGNTPFSLSSDNTAVSISPSTGITPAVVRISVDPTSFQGKKGTTAAKLTLSSGKAVNPPQTIRVLVGLKDPDQRGTIVNVPGKLVDILADPNPNRNRFFVLRQDRNQVLVFDGSNYTQIASLPTGNVPTQLAITMDQRYLLVGSNDSQIIPVFDLETLRPLSPIYMPGGHYPRSIAASNSTVLAAARVAGPTHTIDKVDVAARTATAFPSLGVFENDINVNTNLVASPNGSAILAASANGSVLLYDDNKKTFTVSRKDFESLSGAYAASAYNQYVVGNTLLNSSLVPAGQFETSTGASSGFAFIDQMGFRTTAPDSSSPGVIQKVDLAGAEGQKATRLAEAPVLGDDTYAFTRTIAPLPNRSAIVNLTVSGFTVLSWSYDAAVAPPKVDRVVNAADFGPNIAPGGLITLFGQQLSPVNIATSELPLPTALGDSCLTVNGLAVPMLFVSPTQINAQMPYEATGSVTMILNTPGGVSDNLYLTLLPGAPSVFRTGQAGPNIAVPTIVRYENRLLVTPSNPVHRGDTLVIYLTGLGQTSPAVQSGSPAPLDSIVHVLSEPTVEIGGTPLSVRFAGLAPGQVGLYQINADVPGNARTGLSVPLTISQGGTSTTMNVRVVE